MQKIVEVYCLDEDIETQLSQYRAGENLVVEAVKHRKDK
jgi:hypothetical protein